MAENPPPTGFEIRQCCIKNIVFYFLTYHKELKTNMLLAMVLLEFPNMPFNPLTKRSTSFEQNLQRVRHQEYVVDGKRFRILSRFDGFKSGYWGCDEVTHPAEVNLQEFVPATLQSCQDPHARMITLLVGLLSRKLAQYGDEIRTNKNICKGLRQRPDVAWLHEGKIKAVWEAQYSGRWTKDLQSLGEIHHHSGCSINLVVTQGNAGAARELVSKYRGGMLLPLLNIITWEELEAANKVNQIISKIVNIKGDISDAGAPTHCTQV